MYLQVSSLFFGFVSIMLIHINSATELTMGNNKSMVNTTSVYHQERFKVVDWKFDTLKTYFIYSFFIIIVVLMKISYFHIPKLSSYIPESCILVIAGIIFGIIVKFSLKREIKYFKLTPHIFFSVLLPPIILESSYSLYHRNFLDNILSILVFAVFGTLFNFLIIGLSLWGLSRFGAMQNLNLDVLHCLLFSSLIVAVDPVAVLAIFQDVGVNPDLYYLVFGESLLNDAVTVVLYEMMQEFAMMAEIGATNITLGFLSFFTVSLGGMFIGIVIGVISCLIIRLMNDENTLLLEPILLISTGYMSYLCGDVFGWSGIISTIACGLVQASYAFYSISDKSRLVLKRFVKIIASICEALIFLFLGVELAVGKLSWHTSFSLCSLFLCLITRFIVTFALSGVINKIHMSLRSIPLREKVIISYGGLRGAVVFSLAILIKPEVLPANGITEEIIITTALFIILFTIIVQGISIKPLVKVLQIAKETESKRLSLMDELNESVFDATTAGIDSILGKCGRDYLFMLIEKFDSLYLRPILQGNSSNSYAKILAINEKINYAMVARLTEQQSSQNIQKSLPDSYLNLMSLVSNQNKIMTLQNRRQQWKPLLRHALSVSRNRQGLKPFNHLQPILFRTSARSIDDNHPYETSYMPYLYQNIPKVVEAKNKFLNFRKSQKVDVPATPLIIMEDLSQENPNKDKYF